MFQILYMPVNGCVIKFFLLLNLAIWLLIDFSSMSTCLELYLSKLLQSTDRVSLILFRYSFSNNNYII